MLYRKKQDRMSRRNEPERQTGHVWDSMPTECVTLTRMQRRSTKKETKGNAKCAL